MLIVSGTAAPSLFADDDAALTVYLVRHAEKVLDGSQNPALIAEGEARAEWLAAYFLDKPVDHIFSTNYQRTLDTAAPTAAALQVPVTHYDPRDLAGFADQLETMQGAVLVVGHSNTTPMLAGLLSGVDLPYLGEEAYSEIYIVDIPAGGAATVTIEHSELAGD